MLKVNSEELRDVVEKNVNEEGTMIFLGGANSGKTSLAKEVVSILSDSRKVGFVTDDSIEGTLTYIEDALGEAVQPDVWVIDAPLTFGMKDKLLDTGAKLIWFTSRNRLSGDEGSSVAESRKYGDDHAAFNVEYFIEA